MKSVKSVLTLNPIITDSELGVKKRLEETVWGNGNGVEQHQKSKINKTPRKTKGSSKKHTKKAHNSELLRLSTN